MGRISRTSAAMVASLAGLALGLAACESDKIASTRHRDGAAARAVEAADAGESDAGDGEAAVEEEEPAQNTPQLSEAEVMTFLQTTCAECHGEDDQGNKAPNFAAWPMAKDALSLDAFETSLFAPLVYASLYNKVAKSPAPAPSPMPQKDLSRRERAQVRGVLGWFNVNLPFVVAEAEQSFGIVAPSSAGTTLHFTCSSPITTRQFLSRVTAALFDRPPTPAELAELAPEVLAAPVTREIRDKIVAKLRQPDWKADFVENGGLKKLADAIGGGPAIDQSADQTRGLPEGASADLKQEFFQLLRSKYDAWDYEEFLTTSTVMVTARTAALYGCTPPADPTAWAECEQKPPRGGFFTTAGYLNSKPSSFLRENNNYGRVATMYLTLMGQGFRAATNGPAGGDVKPLPDCLETTDTRRRADAARGTAAIPAFGNVCQACHVSRNLAAGSVLFRPFAANGALYDPATLGDPGAADKEDFDLAVAPEWKFSAKPGEEATSQVDTAWLKSLLGQSLDPAKRKSCAVTGNAKEPTVPLASVNDLARYLMRNQSSLVRGFVRHAHRAYSISQKVNFDLVYTALATYEAGKRKIPDLLEAYFGSETFACAAGD